jgi:hypothetical protein
LKAVNAADEGFATEGEMMYDATVTVLEVAPVDVLITSREYDPS